MPVLTRYDRYLTDHEAFASAFPPDGVKWLQLVRDKALARFSEIGLPIATRGNEDWKYTSVIPIANASFQYPFEPAAEATPSALHAVAPWDNGWVTLVFLDGHYTEGLSKMPSKGSGVRIMRLAEALTAHREIVEKHLTSLASLEADGFTALNTAFLRDGAFVYLPDGTSLGTPLHLLFVSTERPEPTAAYPRTLVVAERGSKLTLIESYVGLAPHRYLTDAVTEIVLGGGAEIDHYRFTRESDEAFHIGVTRIHQGQDSKLSSTSFSRGAAIARNDLHVIIDGPGATCLVNGLYMTSGTQHIDNHIDIDHVKPHTTSREFFKGILDGKSKAIFSGKVVVHKGAIKTNAMQTDKNLILSEGAEVDTKPSLEIYADDVKCGHGATAGRIDETTLFYMRSRGLDLETASNFLIHAFASEIIDTVKVDSFREYLDRMFSAYSRTLPILQFGRK